MLVAAAVLVLQTGCGSSAISTRQNTPRVLAEARGICPAHTVYVVPKPDACRFIRAWNAISPIFRTPHRGWGVAYAFNCGDRARDFRLAEQLPGMDHMALAGPELHARRGSGYIMIPRSRMIDLLDAVPPEFKVNGNDMDIVLATECTWHVKAIMGSRQDVAAAVPPVPPVASRWWERKHT